MYSNAVLLVQEYGDNAENIAENAMYKHMEAGNIKEAAFWLGMMYNCHDIILLQDQEYLH